MRSLRIAVLLMSLIALLSVAFAQKGGAMAKGKMGTKPVNAQAMKARKHGKMTMKIRGKGMAAIAKHHGMMTKESAEKRRRHHRRMKRHHHRVMKTHIMKATMKKGDGDNDADDMKKKGK